jgi:hypothetical protein
VLGIQELAKPEYQKCPHQRVPDGDSSNRLPLPVVGDCAIYEDRPASCRAYQCLWLQGALENTPLTRPDSLGVVFGLADMKLLDRKVVMAHECWPGAMEGGLAKALVNRLKESMLVLTVRGSSSRSLTGPPDEVVRAARLMRERIEGGAPR